MVMPTMPLAWMTVVPATSGETISGSDATPGNPMPRSTRSESVPTGLVASEMRANPAH